MERGGLTKLGSFVLILVIIVIAIAAIIWAGRTIFDGGQPIASGSNDGQKALTEITADSGVRLTARGPITGDETHRSYQITVRPNSRVMTTHQGYVGAVIQTENLYNNAAAYREFSFALSNSGMMDGKPGETETTGLCPTGYIYEFEVLRADDVVQKLWTTSCDGMKGDYAGSANPARRLFLKQIPNSDKMLSKAKMTS